MKKINLLFCGLFLLIIVSACNSGGSIGNQSQTITPTAQSIPKNYQCSPSLIPTSKVKIKLAYASNCNAESAVESQNLYSMGIALEDWHYNHFENNCTGTPVQYDSSTGIGFIVTAAHCVVNATPKKPVGQKIIPSYISIFATQVGGHNNAWIYQGAKAAPLGINDVTAQVMAVYIPSQFCQFGVLSGEACGSPESSNGDIAMLKFKTQPDKSFSISSNLIVAPSNFILNNNGVNNQLMALGYGTTNPTGKSEDSDNPYLFYINYQYYATDSSPSAYGELLPFSVFNAPSTILNGYSINNNSYNLICKREFDNLTS